MKRTSL